MKKLLIAFLFCSFVSFGHEKRPARTFNPVALSYIYGNQTINIMQSTEEIWKDVVGYEGLYKISDQGRMISLSKHRGRGAGYWTKQRFMNFEIDKYGYQKAVLSKDSKCKKYSLHRLVAQHFIPNPENKPQVNHKKGIKTDNRSSELEWATDQENKKHAYNTGLMSMDHLIKYHAGLKRSERHCSKEVHQFSLSGDYINSYPCVADACEAFNNVSIGAAARGHQKTASGFKWSYIKTQYHGVNE